jgi:hypothetical protein
MGTRAVGASQGPSRYQVRHNHGDIMTAVPTPARDILPVSQT